MSWVLAAFSDLTLPDASLDVDKHAEEGSCKSPFKGAHANCIHAHRCHCVTFKLLILSSDPEGPSGSQLLWLWLQKELIIHNC